MSVEEERRLSRELYSKYSFLQTIIGIYVEGVTWGGCQLIFKTKGQPDNTIVNIGSNDLRTGVQNMLIDGFGDYQLNISGEEKSITITMLPEFAFAMEEGGHPLLWPVTRNAGALDSVMSSIGQLTPEKMEIARILLDDICSGIGIPYAFLVEDPKTFLNILGLKNWLMMFKHKNKYIRRSVEFGLIQFARQLGSTDESIEVHWNDDWCSREEYGSAYQIFKAHNIDLVTLRQEELSTAADSGEFGHLSGQIGHPVKRA